MAKRIVIGITGASGAAYGVRLLRELRAARGWESHLVLSDAGALNCFHELGLGRKEVERLAHVSYHVGQIVFIAKAARGSEWQYLSIPPGQSAAYNQNPTGERAASHAQALRDRASAAKPSS